MIHLVDAIVWAAVAAQLDIPLATLDVDQKEKAMYRIKVLEIASSWRLGATPHNDNIAICKAKPKP